MLHSFSTWLVSLNVTSYKFILVVTNMLFLPLKPVEHFPEYIHHTFLFLFTISGYLSSHFLTVMIITNNRHADCFFNTQTLFSLSVSRSRIVGTCGCSVLLVLESSKLFSSGSVTAPLPISCLGCLFFKLSHLYMLSRSFYDSFSNNTRLGNWWSEGVNLDLAYITGVVGRFSDFIR